MSQCLLALDLALNTGYACWKVGDPKPSAGLLEINKHKEMGGRLASLYKWGLRFCKENGVTDICAESPLVAGPGSASEKFWLISAYGVICMMGSQLGVNVVPIANSTMIVNWCGTNNIEKKHRKTMSVLEAQRRGFPKITDHNVADALGLLSLRCCQLNLKTPWDSSRSPGPLFTDSHALKGTTITKANKIAAALIINKATSFNAGEG